MANVSIAQRKIRELRERNFMAEIAAARNRAGAAENRFDELVGEKRARREAWKKAMANQTGRTELTTKQKGVLRGFNANIGRALKEAAIARETAKSLMVQEDNRRAALARMARKLQPRA